MVYIKKISRNDKKGGFSIVFKLHFVTKTNKPFKHLVVLTLAVLAISLLVQ